VRFRCEGVVIPSLSLILRRVLHLMYPHPVFARRNLADSGVADTAGPALMEEASNGTSAAAAAAATQHDSISALLDLDLDAAPDQSAAANLGDALSDLLGGASSAPPQEQQVCSLCTSDCIQLTEKCSEAAEQGVISVSSLTLSSSVCLIPVEDQGGGGGGLARVAVYERLSFALQTAARGEEHSYCHIALNIISL